MPRPLLLVTVFGLAALLSACAASPAPTEAITLTEINDRHVIGQLGIPLGRTTRVRATIVSGRDLHQKSLESSFLLRVTHVDGRSLANPPVLEFSSLVLEHATLARDPFDLHKQKTGESVGSLTDDQIAKDEIGFVGKTVELDVYETGAFTGIADNLPRDAPLEQGMHFSFLTWLVVVKDTAGLDTTDAKGATIEKRLSPEEARHAILELIRANPRTFIGEPNADILAGMPLKDRGQGEYGFGVFVINPDAHWYRADIGESAPELYMYRGSFMLREGQWLAQPPEVSRLRRP